LKGVPDDRLAVRRLASRPISERMLAKRWCLTEVPTDNDALLAGMSTPEYRDYYFRAVLQDYVAMERNHRALKHLMEQTDRVHIVGLGTDISFSIKGIPVISCHGEYNLPDGEVFTAPVRDSINGHIHFNTPSVYLGDEWTGVRLTFAAGRIVDATCDQGADKINKVLDVDDGARYAGEFAIGTNKGITRPAKSILFDEKIIGSFHLTPGRCYDDASNGNKSANHWDLVKILTLAYGGGRIEFDDVAIMIDGKFVHPDLLPLNL
jgi:aminopeptidase